MKIGIIVIVALLFVVYRSLKTHYICSKCGASFKVNAFKYIFTIHAMNKRMVKCTNCGHTEMMTQEWNKK